MNKRVKRINILATALFFLSLGVVSYIQTPSVSALTKAEKKACYERWAGRSQGSAGGDDAKSFDEAAFKKTNCYKDETCRIERYEDGAVIHCYNVETGKFDSQNTGNRPSGEKGGGGNAAPSCGELKTSIISCDGDGGNPVVNLLLEIVNFLAVGVGIAVVGGIVWGGMLYASSNGDSTKAKQGITAIVNSVLGLLLFMFTYALINFLVPGGLFN